MSDRVVGIAVLAKEADGSGQLYIQCRYANGEAFDTYIPVSLKPQRPDEKYWTYNVTADTANVHPSLRCDRGAGKEWHNTYNWSVRFQEFDPKKFQNAYTQLRAINAATGERLHD